MTGRSISCDFGGAGSGGSGVNFLADLGRAGFFVAFRTSGVVELGVGMFRTTGFDVLVGLRRLCNKPPWN